MIKTCKKCEVAKSTDEFYAQQQRGKNGQVWRYFDPYCKPCRLQYGADRRRQIKEQAVAYLGGKCADCDLVDHAVVYDFHHLDPEQKDFSIGKNTRVFASIQSELDKCILLCSNCHRKHHYAPLAQW